MDGGAWRATVHGVAKSRRRLNDCTFTFHFPALEKEMATHSSVLAWRIPGTEEPGGLPSVGSHRVGHNWSDLAAAAAELVLKLNKYWDKGVLVKALISTPEKCFYRCVNFWHGPNQWLPESGFLATKGMVHCFEKGWNVYLYATTPQSLP